MWAKFVIAGLMVVMIAGALHFKAIRTRALLASQNRNGPVVRLMTWNIGYDDQATDSRAHTADLKAVADVINNYAPDAVALQELANPEQLNTLLTLLHRRYTGAIAPMTNADRVEAVLVKDQKAQFQNVEAGGQYALSATFKPHDAESVVLISAHADAFRAARRRIFTNELVDWAQTRRATPQVFIAGDLNLEVDTRNQSHFYTDNLKNDSEAYAYILKYFRDLGRDAGDTSINDRRIDYIFGPRESIVRQAQVLQGVAVSRMDHLPLIIEVFL
jgi:endonuclease/exonuclease/phosphatase family metal-dependent hydrolase